MTTELPRTMELPKIGCLRSDLDTPALVVDVEALDRNIARLATFCRSHGAAWRPHAKSYKCAWLARRVVAAGAIGVTCAKLGEAELFAAEGVRDLLITSPLVGKKKLDRLVALRQIADPIAVVDDPRQVQAIGAAAAAAGVTVRLLIEVDLGLKRCGVAPGAAAVELGRTVVRSPGVELAGIMGWEGHLLTLTDRHEKAAKIAAALGLLAETRDSLRAAGLPCPIVSAGGTGSFPWTTPLGIATEIQAGGGILMDLFYRNKCQIEQQEFALFVEATVISRPTKDRVVLDVGRKSLSPDLHLPEAFGRDDLKTSWLSAEHAVLEVTQGAGPALGERITLVPGYGDWTTVLHDRLYVFRGERLESIEPLLARGRAD